MKTALSATSALNNAKDKQLRYTQRINLINHQLTTAGLTTTRPETTNSLPAKKRVVGGYNIISGLDYNQHHYLPPGERPSRCTTMGGKQGQRKFNPMAHRDFNLLTNQYYTRHENRQCEEKEQAKSKAADSFWKTHTFDPIKNAFYDNEKESHFQQKRVAKSLVHGEKVASQLPPSERYSEGRSYNIIDKRVVNEHNFNRLSRFGNRALANKNAPLVEARLQKVGQKRFELQEARKLNRVSYMRLLEPYRKGYDLVTCQSKVLPSVKDPTPPDLWK